MLNQPLSNVGVEYLRGKIEWKGGNNNQRLVLFGAGNPDSHDTHILSSDASQAVSRSSTGNSIVFEFACDYLAPEEYRVMWAISP